MSIKITRTISKLKNKFFTSSLLKIHLKSKTDFSNTFIVFNLYRKSLEVERQDDASTFQQNKKAFEDGNEFCHNVKFL